MTYISGDIQSANQIKITINDDKSSLEELKPIDVKTYSLARKIFEGIALIFANIVTIGFINIFKAVRDEYRPVFGNTPAQPRQLKEIGSVSSSSSIDTADEPLLTDFQKTLFPPCESDNPVLIDKFPEEVKAIMDEHFGIKDIVSKLPTCAKIVDDDFLLVNDVPYPIMKGIDKNGYPCIFVKLRDANCDTQNINSGFKQLKEDIVEYYSSRYKITPEEAEEMAKKNYVEMHCKKTFTIALREQFRNLVPEGTPSFLRIVGDTGRSGEPLFGSLFTRTSGTRRDPVPEFHKLMEEGGIATDINGNQWKLALN
jgi:hypothetical protein